MSEYNGREVPEHVYYGDEELIFSHYVLVEEDVSESDLNRDSAQLIYLLPELEDSKIFRDQKILTFALVLLTKNLEYLPSSNMTEEYLVNLLGVLSEACATQREDQLLLFRPFTFSEKTCVKAVEPKTNQIIPLNAVIGTIGAQPADNLTSGEGYRQGSVN